MLADSETILTEVRNLNKTMEANARALEVQIQGLRADFSSSLSDVMCRVEGLEVGVRKEFEALTARVDYLEG